MTHLCYFCLVFAMLSCTSVYLCLVVTCLERADLLALVCDVLLCVPIGILGKVWYLIVLIPDLCPLSYLVPLACEDVTSSPMLRLVDTCKNKIAFHLQNICFL